MARPQRTVLTITLCISFVLTACSSNNNKQLQIRHSFDTHSDRQAFDFEMTWFVPPAVLFGNEKNSILANMGLKTRPQVDRTLSIDNETRLRLEDIAIKRLENELVDHEMCQNGYAINQTNWLARSIRFVGRCDTP